MAEPVATLEERLRSACEEAEALVWYFARHCPGGSDAEASAAYAGLVRALSAAQEKKDETSCQELLVSYHKLACYTFAAHEVHGKSILDTTRRPRTLGARLFDRRRLPVVLGLLFFGFALLFEMLEAWINSVVGADGAGTGAASTSDKVFWATLLASCQRRLKIRPKGGAKDCHLGWWSDLGVRLGVGDAVRGFFGGSGQRSHAELKRSAPAGRPQGGMVYRIGVSLATRALGARCRPGPSDGVPQFSYRHCFCGRGFG